MYGNGKITKRERDYIKFDRIDRRNKIKVYDGLNPQAKRLVKLEQRIDNLNKEIGECWVIAYAQGFVPMKNTNPPIMDTLCTIEKLRDRLRKSQNRLIKKYNLNYDEIINYFAMINRVGRYYGGSF